MDREHIPSPVEVDNGGWRGRVLGVTRIGGKAGFAAALLLAVFVGLIVYGISTAGHRRSSSSPENATLTKASEQHEPWWQTLPDAQPSPPILPTTAPTPLHVALPPPNPRREAAVQRVPDLQPLSTVGPKRDQIARENAERRRALLDAAEKAPITVRLDEHGGQSGHADTPPVEPTVGAAAVAAGASIPTAPADSRDQQAAMIAALGASHDQLPSVLRENASHFVLRAGSVIPATLLTGINAQLPGAVIAQVRDDVFDSVGGRYLLVPRGTKLTGSYDNRVVQGQRRVLVAWTRLLYPDGASLDLLGMEGSDPSGYAGFGAKVDEHLAKTFDSALLLSVIGAGAQLSQPQQSTGGSSAPSVGQAIAGAVGQQIANTSIQLTQREMQVPPTLEVAPGYRFDVLVDRDIVLPRSYDEGTVP
jgi:type IV secretory pathway VirB10-like protein